MKKIFICCAALLATAFSACSDDGNTAPADAPRPVFSVVESDEESFDGAWISAEYTYSGTEQIAAAGFGYKVNDATSGYNEVRCAEGDWSQTNAWCQLEGLKADTEYRYYCFLVIGGERYNSISRTFTTAPEGVDPPEPEPAFGTPAARNPMPRSAELTCIYSYRGEQPIEKAGYRYRKTTAGTYADFELQDISSPLTCTIEGLDPNTDYTFHAYITAGGKTYRSAEATFTTAPEEDEPAFKTPESTGMTDTNADLSCYFIYAGDKTIAETGFYYKQTAGGNFTKVKTGGRTSPIRLKLTGLTPATGYTYYAYIVLDGETFRSAEATFTTRAEQLIEPVFGTPSSGSVTVNSAAVSCTLAYDGNASDITEAGFSYKAASTSTWLKVSVTATPGSKSATLGSLAPATTYNFLLYAVIGGKRFESAEGSFTTQRETGTTTAKYAGWAELPGEIAKAGDYYYAYHMRSDQRSIRNYSVCYSADMRCAVWTAAPMHTCYDGNAGRNDTWNYDPVIPRSVQPNLKRSYSGTYSRGHMVASSDRQVSVSTNQQTFYYTNMAPQYQNHFNGGIWEKLEKWCLTQRCSDTLYVVTGAHFANKNRTTSDRDGNRVVVPTHFYKLLMRSKSGNTRKPLWQLSANEIECVGFWFEHNESYATTARPTAQYMKSVAEIENITGFEFFPNVPNAPKEKYNASFWGM